jgi:hypothetical protein
MGRNLRGIAVFCGLVIFLSGKPSFAQEMVPIQKYIDQNGSERNPDAANFLFLRCATILLLVGSLLQNDQDQSLHATGKQYWEGVWSTVSQDRGEVTKIQRKASSG